MNKVLKRIFDLIFSIVTLLVLLPVITCIIFCSFFSNHKPILFIQERPGYKGKLFKIYKFRTMRDIYGDDGELASDDKRLTTYGKILRRTSMDELPELWNVIKGDMSVIGPRPLLKEYIELYSKEQNRRHDVLPGITGWAQVNGRNDISWDDKFKLDIWYVDNHNFILDLYILFLTLVKVVTGSGVNKSGYETTDKFNGSKS